MQRYQIAAAHPSTRPWVETMIADLNRGFALYYGTRPHKEPEPVPNERFLHPTMGFGPPYRRRGKRGNT